MNEFLDSFPQWIKNEFNLLNFSLIYEFSSKQASLAPFNWSCQFSQWFQFPNQARIHCAKTLFLLDFWNQTECSFNFFSFSLRIPAAASLFQFNSWNQNFYLKVFLSFIEHATAMLPSPYCYNIQKSVNLNQTPEIKTFEFLSLLNWWFLLKIA